LTYGIYPFDLILRYMQMWRAIAQTGNAYGKTNNNSSLFF